MKGIKLVLLLCLITTYNILNAQNCNINAGGDEVYCYSADTLKLYGATEGINISSVTWSIINQPTGGGVLTLLSPTSLASNVVSSSTFIVGTYQFEISGNCQTSGLGVKRDTVTITITPDVTVAEIYDENGFLLIDNPYEVCTSVELSGNLPSSGETSYWSSSLPNSISHNFSTSGDTLTASMSSIQYLASCTEVNYSYVITNGGCVSTDTALISYQRIQNPVAIYGGDRNICGSPITVRGTNIGCNSTPTWSVVPHDMGVTIPTITLIQSGTGALINVVESGAYDVIYSVASNGPCEGGMDTVTLNVCVDPVAGIGNDQTFRYCNEYPDTLFLTSNVVSGYSYGNWYAPGGSIAPAVITQTGVGQAYVTDLDPSRSDYWFVLDVQNVVSPGCNSLTPPILCPDLKKRVYIYLDLSVDLIEDTLNIVCQGNGIYYQPIDYMTTSGLLVGSSLTITAIQVPGGCQSIIQDQSYDYSASLDFSCQGNYLFEIISGIGSECKDTLNWVVNVVSLQNPNAGSDAYIDNLCLNDTVPLVGNEAYDADGNVIQIIKTWTGFDGPTNIEFVGSPNNQIVNATGFSVPGVYSFMYSFSNEEGCYLTDTMQVFVNNYTPINISIDTIICEGDIVVINNDIYTEPGIYIDTLYFTGTNCDSAYYDITITEGDCTPCPEFELLTCCTLPTDSLGNKNSEILNAINDYNYKAQLAYPLNLMKDGDLCCDFCQYPEVAFPVFIYDESGVLINDLEYVISWSNDSSNNTAIGYIYPHSMVTVSVSGPDSCYWEQVFFESCCEKPGIDGFCCDSVDFEIYIDSLCNFNPCDYPNTQFPIRVLEDGVVLTTAGYSFLWSNGSTGSAVSVSQNQLPISVSVTNNLTGCTAESIFDVDCEPILPCLPPIDFKCIQKEEGQLLQWSSVTGAVSYEISITYNDGDCCSSIFLGFPIIISTTNPEYLISNLVSCFSWKVRSICEDGSKSEWGAEQCSCNSGITFGNESLSSVDVRPNPAHEVVIITVDNPLVVNSTELEILDVFGRSVYKSKIQNNTPKRIDVSKFGAGLYIYQIIDGNNIIEKGKLVIE